jgi:hypothetical protein
MRRDGLRRPSLVIALAIVLGAGTGSAVVLGTAVSWTPSLQLSVSYLGPSAWPVLGCPNYTPGQCVNISIGFTGAHSLDPNILRVSIRPVDGSVVVNGTAGAAINLSYSPNGIPELWGDRGGGNFSDPPGGSYINPDGRQVGWSGDSSVAPGAVLCLMGWYLTTAQEYTLTFSYRGTSATVVVPIS